MSHDAFVHLHVASGFSMRYGASSPAVLVERAAELGQSALALTDRDGLYGAVRFVQACDAASLAPILGVDLALEDTGTARPETPGMFTSGLPSQPRSEGHRVRHPVRGGQLVDPRWPRVTVLARGQGGGLAPAHGWDRLCRLVTATHLRGERGKPVTTRDLVARHADLTRSMGGDDDADSRAKRPSASRHRSGVTGLGGDGALLVLLGPDSDVGRAVLAHHDGLAAELLDHWIQVMPAGGVVVEVVCHGGPEGSPASLGHAARMLALGMRAGVPCVLTAAVRHARVEDAATVDILDAARRLVPLSARHLDRTTTAGHLASAPAMYAVARRITRDDTMARTLLARSLEIARECAQDSRTDLGVGAVHLPETEILGLRPDEDPQEVLARRCRDAVMTRYGHRTGSGASLEAVRDRLEDELAVIAALGYPAYFLTVATVTDLIRDMGVRVAARGSGAGSLVTYLLGISGVDPMAYGLLMERFCTPLRAQLPDIDIDVESARRTEIYQRVLDRFGGERVTCVSMMDSYRVRHAVRDVGAALGLPAVEIDAIATAFPHIRARDARAAIAELPELRASGLGAPRLQVLFDLVERLDGLPRHIAVHPCGVVLSNAGLLGRTPVEASWLGFPMSQFDKDDVETLGLLKLDILGIRMQSAMAHAVTEIARVEDIDVDIDDRQQVPLDDPATFDLIRSTRTLGCFQIESPGQRELVGKFAPETFEDIIIDISLFRPGPVKSDMVTPFLRARQGWTEPDLLHPSLAAALGETCGVVVFHEQVLQIIAVTTGISLAEADEVRRALGSTSGQDEVERWWRPLAARRGYNPAEVDRIWDVLKAFASFGFCKAHAAAFALPTYQSAWLKAHHPAAFLAGVLTHDPGMYPKRLILDDARQFGVSILGLDVNRSGDTYRVERTSVPTTDQNLDESSPGTLGIRLALTDVKGISETEVQAVLAGQPYASLGDFWQRAHVSRPVSERMILAGGFDAVYGIGTGLGRRGRVTRRDLLLHLGELDRWSRSAMPSRRRKPHRTDGRDSDPIGGDDVRARAAAQSQGSAPVAPAAVRPTQLMLDLDDAPTLTPGTGLPELTRTERVHAELDILGLDATEHVVAPYEPVLAALGVVRADQLRDRRSRTEVLVAGVKVATQTPPVRSGRRVVFLTLDDATGPIDATFFEDAQGPYAATVFHSWMLLVRGVIRRTGPKGISLRATGAWELSTLWAAWTAGGIDAVWEALAEADERAWALAETGEAYDRQAGVGAARSRSTRPVMEPVRAPSGAEGFSYGGGFVVSGDSRNDGSGAAPGDDAGGARAGGMGGGRRRVLVHPSGFRQSPYADVRPPGEDVRSVRGLADALDDAPPQPPRRLWHASPGSSGR